MPSCGGNRRESIEVIGAWRPLVQSPLRTSRFPLGARLPYNTRAMTDSLSEQKPDLVLELNFVPHWARTAPSSSPYAHTGDRGGEAPRETRRFDKGGRDEDRSRRRPRRERPDGAASRGGPRPERPAGDFGRPRDFGPPPVQIEFLPERTGLLPLARRLGVSKRAYALFDVAGHFLTQPRYYAVRIAVAPSAEAAHISLYQCRECQCVFLDEEQAFVHAFARHLDRFYIREERKSEAPKGHFVCVARCGLSGELLGPPNYHGFNETVLELHRSRFPDMPIAEYRRHIQNMHDAPLIEQWKAKMCTQTVYRLRD